jgi:hypothetical protein
MEQPVSGQFENDPNHDKEDPELVPWLWNDLQEWQQKMQERNCQQRNQK